MLDTLSGMPKYHHRPMDFFIEAMLAELVPLLQSALWCAALALLPWAALGWAGWTDGWTTLAAASSTVAAGSIPMMFGLRRIARRAARQYRAYAAYEDQPAM